jgi:hypothetical protein
MSMTDHRDDEGGKHFPNAVNFCQTKMRIIPEDSHLHTRRRENLNLTYYPII